MKFAFIYSGLEFHFLPKFCPFLQLEYNWKRAKTSHIRIRYDAIASLLRHNGGAYRRCSARRSATSHNSAYPKCRPDDSVAIPPLRIRRRRYMTYFDGK